MIRSLTLSGLLITLLGFTISPCFAGPEIIAHRGASSMAPENTLASFRTAWEVGADAVELDIYLTTDNRIVVIHDSTTRRVSGVDMIVSKSSSQDLRKLDVGKWKGQQWTNEKIPYLEEVLKTVPKGKRIFIEVKCGPEIIPEMLKIIKASGLDRSQIVIISFSSEVIRTIEMHRPTMTTYWLCSINSKPGSIEKSIETAKAIKTDGIDVAASAEVNSDYAKMIREAKLGFYVWTVDNPAIAKRMADLGVDGITTNKPVEIRNLLFGKQP
jgi:glycerophosphoryl diester phosphodiesterase